MVVISKKDNTTGKVIRTQIIDIFFEDFVKIFKTSVVFSKKGVIATSLGFYYTIESI